MLSSENWCLALSGQFQQTIHWWYVYFFSENNLTIGDNLHEMSNPVSLEDKKLFQNVCWKLMLSTLGTNFNRQHLEILIFPRKQQAVFFEKSIINLLSSAELAQRVIKVVHWWADSHSKLHLWDLKINRGITFKTENYPMVQLWYNFRLLKMNFSFFFYIETIPWFVSMYDTIMQIIYNKSYFMLMFGI